MRLTIKYKLFAAFAAVLAMMALLGFTAASSTSRMSADTEVFDQKMLPSARTVGELKNQTGKFRRDQVRYDGRPDGEARDGIAEGLAEDVARDRRAGRRLQGQAGHGRRGPARPRGVHRRVGAVPVRARPTCRRWPTPVAPTPRSR